METSSTTPISTSHPFTIATISAGFEKGDFLVREEQGARIYFDFFEEAFNYIANKGYSRMSPDDEKEWIELMNVIHDSVKGGMKYNTGTLLMVLSRPLPRSVAEVSTAHIPNPMINANDSVLKSPLTNITKVNSGSSKNGMKELRNP